MGGSAFNNLQQNIKDHEEEYYDDDDDLGFSSSSPSDDDGSSSDNSSSSDLVEDGTTTTTTATSSSSSIADHDQLIANNKGGPLDEMSSLMHQLPFKRGLSKFYQGKSQSFTSLSNVRSLEDLAKPENPYNKRLKSCRSYGGFFISENQHQKQSKAFSRAIAKKSSSSSRVTSCSSLSAKRSHSFLGLNRPPIAPQKNSTATTLCNQQTPLFV